MTEPQNTAGLPSKYPSSDPSNTTPGTNFQGTPASPQVEPNLPITTQLKQQQNIGQQQKPAPQFQAANQAANTTMPPANNSTPINIPAPPTMAGASGLTTATTVKPPGKKKNTKVMVLGFILLMLLTLGSAAGLYLNQQNQNLKQQAAGPQPTTKPLPAGQINLSEKDRIAQRALNCLDQMRDDRGVYYMQKICGSDGSCNGIPDNNSGPRPIYARFQYYNKTQDQAEFSIFKKDLEIYNSTVNGIQNNHLNCSLIAEIHPTIEQLWQDNFIMKTERNRAKNICVLSKYNQALVDIADQNLDSQAAQTPIFKTIYNRLTSSEPERDDRILLDTSLATTSIYAADYAGKYQILTNDKSTELKRAQFFYNQAIEMLIRHKKQLKIYDVCLLGQASVDLGQATANQEYYDFASYLWGLGAGDTNHDFRTKAVCTFFTDQLYQATMKPELAAARDQLMQNLIDNHLDKKGSTAFLTGDGCFNSEANEQGQVIKATTENSLLIDVLLK